MLGELRERPDSAQQDMASEVSRPPWTQRRLPHFNYASPDYALFVTICALPGTAPFAEDRLARVVFASLDWLRIHRGLRIYAYCLMPDHLHLLVQLSPGSKALGVIIGAFKRWTTRQSWGLGYHGALWQGRYHDYILRENDDGQAIARYILANPGRKGLEGEDGEYPYKGTLDPL